MRKWLFSPRASRSMSDTVVVVDLVVVVHGGGVVGVVVVVVCWVGSA